MIHYLLSLIAHPEVLATGILIGALVPLPSASQMLAFIKSKLPWLP